MDIMKYLGRNYTRSGGSLGVWDIIVVWDTGVALQQVKSNRWPSPAERQEMLDFPAPKTTWKEIIRIDDGDPARNLPPKIRVKSCHGGDRAFCESKGIEDEYNDAMNRMLEERNLKRRQRRKDETG